MIGDNKDIISYLSWCEVQGIEPFGEDKEEQTNEYENDNDDKIDIDKVKELRKERRNK